jgi:ubiquinone/menaquinone biosynthesis C-methylase UbiE
MSEASARWYARVEKAIQELHRVLQEQQRRAAAAMQSQTDAQKR